MEQLGSHWSDFDEIWYLSFCRKSVEKVQYSLKSDKNNGYFTWRRFHILATIVWILHRMRNISNKIRRENQNTRSKFSNFFSENIVVYEIMSKAANGNMGVLWIQN
jgi:hypothetical protein